MGGHQSTQCPHEIITRLSSRGRGWFLSRAHPGLQICIGSGIHRQNGVPVLAAKPLPANTVACTCRGSTPIPMFSTANAQQYHQNKQRSPRPERPEQATEPHRNFTASFPHKGSEQCRLAESRAVQIIQAEKNSHFFSAYAATIPVMMCCRFDVLPNPQRLLAPRLQDTTRECTVQDTVHEHSVQNPHPICPVWLKQVQEA